MPDPAADGGWVLNGTKCWMSGVVEADWYTVFAKTKDPASRAHDSITAFIVERAWDGVAVGRTDHKMGVRGVDTGELLLTDVHVPAENVIGEVGGFRLAMLGLNAMRPIVAARGIGLAEGALMYATEYVQQRAAFGQTIADFQGIQWEIAKCAVDIEAARLLTYRAAVFADEGKFTKEFVPYLSMAKYHATELAVRASSLAVQLLGAAGYMEDHPTEQWYRDAKQLTIVEGRRRCSSDSSPVACSTRTCGGTDLAGGSARLSRREWLRAAAEAEQTLQHRPLGRGAPARSEPLALLRAKGETAEEVTGLARAMVGAAVPCPLDGEDAEAAVDLHQDGSDRLSTSTSRRWRPSSRQALASRSASTAIAPRRRRSGRRTCSRRSAWR